MKRLVRRLLALVLAASVALTVLTAARIALSPDLAPWREATAAEITAAVTARTTVPTVAARATSDGCVEALEWPANRFALGVQWHPELHRPEHGVLNDSPLLFDFLAAAQQVRLKQQPRIKT